MVKVVLSQSVPHLRDISATIPVQATCMTLLAYTKSADFEQPGDLTHGTRGTISRVVAGRLFYVEAAGEVFAVKPNAVRIREKDGSLARYRGEPLRAVGVKQGAPVTVRSSGPVSTIVIETRRSSPGSWIDRIFALSP